MSFITGKHMPRRTFLRGMGATVALPFLDAMVPAGRVLAGVRESGRTRLVCIEEVHGLAGCNEWGARQGLYAPTQAGTGFELVPDNPLTSLLPYRDYLTIVSNTDVRMAEAFEVAEVGADHFRSTSVFLTQAKPKQTQGSDIYCGTSLDQLYAQKFGMTTAMPSMQFCIDTVDQAGGCNYNYSCAYLDALSWASPNEPMPMIRDPRVAFDMLFGAGTTLQDRVARRQSRRTVLDWITEEVATMRQDLGASDRLRLDRYLENMREVERRIQMVEAHNTSGEQRELPGAPVGVPDSFTEHMRIMFDLQVLAFQADMTRITSFKTGRDAQNRVFPEAETNAPFHPTSHHGNREDRIVEFNKINKFRVGQLPYFLEKMKATTTDGDASLLDRTLIIWGSPMADANVHNHRRCPLILLGKGGGILKGNLHLKAADGTPMANVFLTLLTELGVEVNSFGDSNGRFSVTQPVAIAN